MKLAPWTKRGQELRQKQTENSNLFTMGSGKDKRTKSKRKKGEFLNASVVLAGEILEGLIRGIVEGMIFVTGLQR